MVSSTEKTQILKNSLLGLMLAFPDVWQKIGAELETWPIIAKDQLFGKIVQYGQENE